MESNKKKTGSREGKQFAVDCSEAGKGCTLKVSGTYDEVVGVLIPHVRTAHGMAGDDAKITESIKSFIKEDTSASGVSGRPQSFQRGAGAQTPRLPS